MKRVIADMAVGCFLTAFGRGKAVDEKAFQKTLPNGHSVETSNVVLT